MKYFPNPVKILFLCLATCLAGTAISNAKFDSIPTLVSQVDQIGDSASHDLDRDGDQDLVYLSVKTDNGPSNPRTCELGWLENPGDGTAWTRKEIKILEGTPEAIEVVDLDGDGRNDLVTSTFAPWVVTWHRGLEDLKFGPPTVIVRDVFDIREIDAADLNGDGRMDLVIAAYDGPRWLRQLEDGKFALERRYASFLSSSVQFQRVALDDFDNDGDIDIVTTSSENDRVIFSRNNGRGTFSPQVTLSEARRVRALDTGDLDGDGLIDIVSAALEGDNVRIFWSKNLGAGVFEPERVLSRQIPCVALAVADFDHDGDLDIAGAGNDQIFWFENRGLGVFSPQKRIGDAVERIFGLTPTDVDGDGDADLLSVQQYFNGVIAVYRNNFPIPVVEAPEIENFAASDTSVASSTTLSWSTKFATDITITPDLGTVSASGSQEVQVDGTRTFTLTASNSVGSASAELTIVVNEAPIIRSFGAADETVARGTFADFSWQIDGADEVTINPQPDTVTGSTARTTVTETTTFTLTASNEFGTSEREITITAGELPTLSDLKATPAGVSVNETSLLTWNAEGAETTTVSGVGAITVGEAIAVQPISSRNYTVTVTNDFGSVSAMVEVTVSGDLYGAPPRELASQIDNPSQIKLADLDNDGAEDILVVSLERGGTPIGLNWLPKISPGMFGPLTPIFGIEGTVFDIFASDLDLDGDLDPGTIGGPSPIWAPNVLNDGDDSTSFLPPRPIPLGDNATGAGRGGFFIGHINDDGYPDYVGVFNWSLYLFYGTANGGYGAGQLINNFGGSVNYVPFVAGDLDGDGDVDLVAGKNLEDELFWFENEGGRFTQKKPIAPGAERITNIFMIDTDGDGDLDLVVRGDFGSFGVRGVHLYENNGGGDLSTIPKHSIRSNVTSIKGIEFSDIDLDQDLDIIFLGAEIEFHENDGSNEFTISKVIDLDQARINAKGMAVGDIDGDSDPDVLVTGDRAIVVYENTFSPSIAPHAVDSAPSLSLTEDFGQVRYSLAPLFSDADTELGELRFSIQSDSSEDLFTKAEIGEDGVLILQSGKDRFGSARIVIQATDPEGLIAASALSVEVLEEVDLTLAAVAESAVSAAPGSNSFTLTVGNAGPSEATDLVIQISQVTAADLVRETAIPSAGSFAEGQWLIPALAEGETATLTLSYQIPATSDGGIEVATMKAELTSVAQPSMNPDDDFAIASFSVITAGKILVTEIEAEPTLSRLTGLFSRQIRITNNNLLKISGFGYTLGELSDGTTIYNAKSDDGGMIRSDRDLAPGESMTLTLEYFDPTRSLQKVPLPVIEKVFASDQIAPVPAASGTEVEKIIPLADGDVLLEFPTVSGTRYLIEYSQDMLTWKPAAVAIKASGSRTQWIDNGPPKTDNHPSSVTSRIYRVVTPAE